MSAPVFLEYCARLLTLHSLKNQIAYAESVGLLSLWKVAFQQ